MRSSLVAGSATLVSFANRADARGASAQSLEANKQALCLGLRVVEVVDLSLYPLSSL
jgi:hypothetical protein